MADTTTDENKQDTPPAIDNSAQQEIIDNGKPLPASSGVESLAGIFDAFGEGKDPFAKEEKKPEDDTPVVEEKKEEGVGSDFDNASTKKEEKKEDAKAAAVAHEQLCDYTKSK